MDIFLRMRGIQKIGPDNGLRDPQPSHNQDQDAEEGAKVVESLIGLDQGVSNIHERDIQEIELHAQDAIEDARGSWVKDLHEYKPEERQQGETKGDAECAAAPNQRGPKKR